MGIDDIKSHNLGVHWLLIAVFFAVTLVSAFCQSPLVNNIAPILTIASLFAIAWLHGTVRYGLKNMIVFFLITWLISNFFEALSIQTGFPFGHYYYDKLIGPRLFNVPLIIMFAYFATGYASWILSHVLLGQFANRLQGKHIVYVPIVAAFIMVLWDLCIDPMCSTVASLWVWQDGGPYYGVPLMNYFGWFFVVYLIYQSYAFYLSKYENSKIDKTDTFGKKTFWLEITVLYAIQGLTQVFQYIAAKSHFEIYAAMALISIFTMLFVALLSYLKIENESSLV